MAEAGKAIQGEGWESVSCSKMEPTEVLTYLCSAGMYIDKIRLTTGLVLTLWIRQACPHIQSMLQFEDDVAGRHSLAEFQLLSKVLQVKPDLS